MTRARIVNVCFQVMAAFWAVIVITKAQTPMRWHAYAISRARSGCHICHRYSPEASHSQSYKREQIESSDGGTLATVKIPQLIRT